MSAFGSRADICAAKRHVRFAPETTIGALKPISAKCQMRTLAVRIKARPTHGPQ